MLGPTAVGTEINGVPMPHGKSIGVVSVRDILADVLLQIVDGDRLRQTAGIAFPLPEIAEDHIVGDLRAVRRIGKQSTLVHGERLGQATVNADGERDA